MHGGQESSYQHSYQRASGSEGGDDSAVKEVVDQNGITACWNWIQRSRGIRLGGLILVVLAALACTESFISPWRKPASIQTVACSPTSLIVDDSGITVDGPGSDGVCDDPEHWFHDQLVDHFAGEDVLEAPQNKWKQKYFINDDYFRGPGHPIFFIMGGEDKADCLFYPFVTHTLARMFGGLTLEAEHRFYGKSQPIDPLNDIRDMIGILSPDQAMADYARLLKYQQKEHGCSKNRSSPNYCPVVTVGASYPGFLSAMMRLVYSDLVDMAYASSAPLPLYAQNVDPNAYFDKITESAGKALAGCPAVVKETLLTIEQDIQQQGDGDVHALARRLGICDKHGLLPKYIQTTGLLYNETLFAVAAKFAEFNMGNYPPSPTNDFSLGCAAFVDNQNLDPYQRIQAFWNVVEPAEEGSCFDFHTMIPGGPRGTVFGADWTGGGPGKNGLSWDFQTCKDLVVQTGYGPESMFPEREWTLEALTAHCQYRFGMDPTPKRMVHMWHFDDLLGQNASRILFTNGLNDGWSVDSILNNLSPDIVAINMPNGAHRSDLDHHGPTSRDTDDVRNSFPLIIQTLTRWLKEVRNQMHREECEAKSPKKNSAMQNNFHGD